MLILDNNIIVVEYDTKGTVMERAPTQMSPTQRIDLRVYPPREGSLGPYSNSEVISTCITSKRTTKSYLAYVRDYDYLGGEYGGGSTPIKMFNSDRGLFLHRGCPFLRALPLSMFSNTD